MKYQVKRISGAAALDAAWESADWRDVPVLKVLSARPESSAHRPETELKLQYGEEGFYGLFRVKDRYVRCVGQGFQAPVCQDSCVEFFVDPPFPGYFNFEMNCGGAVLTYYVRDNTRTGHGFKDYAVIPDEWMKELKIFHTMPERVEPEITEPTEWRVGFHIPFAFLRHYGEFATPEAGTFWRGNVYKCGDRTSHPHWLSWHPVRMLNFHRPEDFGVFEFL